MFSTRNILIAGGSQGIGYAITSHFVELGANVVVCSNDEFSSSEVAVQSLQLPKDVSWIYADLSNEQSPIDVVSTARDLLDSPIDTLVYVAGVYVGDSVGMTNLAHVWNSNYFVKVRGSYLTSLAFANQVDDSVKDPCIVLVSSINAIQSEPEHMAYDGACGAVEAQTRALAVHLAPRIRVNCLSPGLVNTRLTQSVMADPNSLAYATHCIPLKRVGLPIDYAGPAEFLCDSTKSGYMTGEVIRVDGGIQAQQAPEPWTSN